MRIIHPKSALALTASALLALTTFACGDDDEPNGPSGSSGGLAGSSSGATSSGGSSSGGNGLGGLAGGTSTGGDESLYAVVTQVFGTDGGDNFSYIILSDDLTGELSLDDGIEVNGRAIAAAPVGEGSLFVATDLEPKVTRYDLNADGDLEETGDVNFDPAGLSSIGEYAGQFHFVSDEKAYFADGGTARIVVWNPEEMIYEDFIDLSDLAFEGERLTFGTAPIAIDDKVMFFPGWRSSDNLKVADRAAVVTIDTATDSVSIALNEGNCGYARDGVLADDGMIYLATEAYGAAVYHLSDTNASAPCLLRFDPEAGEFDDDYAVDLTTLFDGSEAGSLIVGPDNQPFLLRLDATDYEGPPAARPLASLPYWHWYALTPGDEPSVEDVEYGPTGGSVLPARFDDEAFLPFFQGQASTKFVAFESDGPGEELGTVQGLAFSIAKLK